MPENTTIRNRSRRSDGTLAKSVKMQAVGTDRNPIHSMVQIVKGILARGENVRIFTGRVNPNRERINAIRARRDIAARCKAALWAPPSSHLRRGHSSQPDAAVRQWRNYRNFATKLDVDVGSGTLFWSDDKGCELARVKTRRILIASVHPTQLEDQEVTGASCRNKRGRSTLGFR